MAVVLIDADSIYFRAAYKLKKNEIRKTINTIMKDIEAQSFMAQPFVAIKGKGNFRKDLYDGYKSNRNRNYEPELRAALNYGYDYMKDKYAGVPADGMEADDLVSIWAHEAREAETPYIIAGIDKDLLQIPGQHYNYMKQEFTDVDDDQANLNLMLQCLTGDSGDNIPGIKGIGPKRAANILAHVPMERRWNRVRACWRANAAGNPELSLRLLSMVKTWSEYEDIRAQISSKASVSEQDVLPEQEEN